MFIQIDDTSHTYTSIIKALKENLPNAFLLEKSEREYCLEGVEKMERVFERLKGE